MESANNRSKYITIAVLVAIVVIVAGAMAFTRQGSDQQQAADTSSQNPSQQQSTDAGTINDQENAPAAGASDLKDGTYSATGEYATPGGRESINVSVTLKGGVVSDSTAKGSASDGRAARYQRDFEANYQSSVVGKRLEDISLSRVSGSSLTSQGFNDALDQIADQART